MKSVVFRVIAAIVMGSCLLSGCTNQGNDKPASLSPTDLAWKHVVKACKENTHTDYTYLMPDAFHEMQLAAQLDHRYIEYLTAHYFGMDVGRHGINVPSPLEPLDQTEASLQGAKIRALCSVANPAANDWDQWH